MSGKAVTECVGVGRSRRAPVENASHIARTQPISALVAEEWIVVPQRAALGEMPSKRSHGRLAHGHDAHLVTLSVHPNGSLVQVRVRRAQGAHLGDSQPAALEQLEHRVVAGSSLGAVTRGGSRPIVEERRELISPKHARQPTVTAGRV